MGTNINKPQKKRRQYSKEFKNEAVRLSEEKGSKAAAEELGIAQPTMSKWRQIYLDPRSPSPSSGPSYEELLKENQKLKKENGYLNEINEVLKKSTAIFSKDHLGGKK